MSTGKGSKSIRKSQQGNDLLPSVGFLNTVAKHKATLNQTVINLGSLTTPPEATALGFVQPSGGTLAALDLQRYKNNVKVMSTTKGILDNPIDYRITGTSQITLADGAADGEIFTIMVESQPRSGINIVAAQPKVASYLLPAGQTDIPAGTYTVNKNPGEDIGEFIVIVDREVQYRNTGNGVSGGDYQEIAGLVRMNDYDPINDRKVVLVWVGALVDNPQDTQLALIQTLQGQIDAMVPALAAVTGLSESTFQTSPNDPDLLAFSASVIALAARVTALESANNMTSYTPTSGWETGVPSGSLKSISAATVIRINKDIHVTGTAFFRNDTSNLNISWSLPITNGLIPALVSGTMVRTNEAGTGSVGALQRMNAVANNSTTIFWQGSGMGIPGNDGWYTYSFIYRLA